MGHFSREAALVAAVQPALPRKLARSFVSVVVPAFNEEAKVGPTVVNDKIGIGKPARCTSS